MKKTGNYDDFIDENRTVQQENSGSAEDYSGIGRLKIFVFTGNAALPVDGAQVTVYTLGADGNPNVLYELVSDFGGETEEITLETPSIDNSTSPYDQAFAMYYVDVEQPQYETAKGVVVQIFPNTITVLPLNMQPKSQEV